MDSVPMLESIVDYSSAVRLIHSIVAKNPSQGLAKLQTPPEHFIRYASRSSSYFFVLFFFFSEGPPPCNQLHN